METEAFARKLKFDQRHIERLKSSLESKNDYDFDYCDFVFRKLAARVEIVRDTTIPYEELKKLEEELEAQKKFRVLEEQYEVIANEILQFQTIEEYTKSISEVEGEIAQLKEQLQYLDEEKLRLRDICLQINEYFQKIKEQI
jgi:hypothetical protein